MTVLAGLNCPNCGAALPEAGSPGAVLACRYCGTSFRLPASLTPEPEMGDLLLGADFCDPQVPGWVVFNRENLSFVPGPPPELWARFPPSDRIHPVLRSPGPLDDFDVSVTMRFLEGEREYVSAGLEVRSGEAGDYVVRLSAQGTFQVGWHEKTEWGGALIPWTEHPALRRQRGEANRLRLVLRGEQVRLYLNGVLAASLRDGRYRDGLIRLVVSPGVKSAMLAAFSDLQLREAR